MQELRTCHAHLQGADPASAHRPPSRAETGGGAVTRREVLRWIGLAGAGLAAAACTPLRIGLHAWPEPFDAERGLSDRVLRAFVATVVPGVDPDEGDPARVYRDAYYDMARYRAFLASDLCRRSERLHGNPRFDRLPAQARADVIRDGLHADDTTRRLYTGAVYLAQVSIYAGIYDDERGCPLIDFEGRFHPRPLAEFTYPTPGRFLAAGVTADGNYA